MSNILPKEKPFISRGLCEHILRVKNINTKKYPCNKIAVRGFFLDMGEDYVNDRRIFDDALAIITPTAHACFNYNTDPNGWRQGTGTGSKKGMATLKLGIWKYQTGLHKGYPAFRQAEAVTVLRDKIGGGQYEDTGWFGINDHRAGNTTTSSLGCLTTPAVQWVAHKNLMYSELDRHDQKIYNMILISYDEFKEVEREYNLNKLDDNVVVDKDPVIVLPPGSTLRKGDKNELVKVVQKAVGANPDGDFGPKTESAVKKFQKEYFLIADGIVGMRTWQAIENEQEFNEVANLLSGLVEGTLDWYAKAYEICTIDKGRVDQAQRAADRVTAGKKRYEWAEARYGVPWLMVGCLHSLECNNNFKGVLHNGQLIVGTGKKTTIVPKGRGPFETWEDSVGDALNLLGLLKVRDWSIPEILKQCERFNGLGYISGAGRRDTSPYIWGCTNINDGTGKYVADGKYSSTANANAQVGVAAIIKVIQEWGV